MNRTRFLTKSNANRIHFCDICREPVSLPKWSYLNCDTVDKYGPITPRVAPERYKIQYAVCFEGETIACADSCWFDVENLAFDYLSSDVPLPSLEYLREMFRPLPQRGLTAEMVQDLRFAIERGLFADRYRMHEAEQFLLFGYSKEGFENQVLEALHDWGHIIWKHPVSKLDPSLGFFCFCASWNGSNLFYDWIRYTPQ